MNLLVDCHCFDEKTAQGINTYIRGIYSVLPALAPEIDFYFAARNTDNLRELFGSGRNIHYVRLRSDARMRRLLSEFPAIIKRHRIDWAHFQYVAPLIKNCRTIVTLHDILFREFPQYFPLGYRLWRDPLFRLSARRADLLCTVSAYSRSSISRNYGIPPERIAITPNVISEEFAEVSLEESREFARKNGAGDYILYISRFEPRKNQLGLLKSWIRLNPRHDLVMIGNPTLRSRELEEAIAALPAERSRHLHILEGVSFGELKKWYRGASLFVYPTLAEGFGIPPLEAAMAGVPVICSDATAMADFSFFGENLVDIGDSELLDFRIRSLLENPSPPSPAIREEIRRRYGREAIARGFLAILRKAGHQ